MEDFFFLRFERELLVIPLIEFSIAEMNGIDSLGGNHSKAHFDANKYEVDRKNEYRHHQCSAFLASFPLERNPNGQSQATSPWSKLSTTKQHPPTNDIASTLYHLLQVHLWMILKPIGVKLFWQNENLHLHFVLPVENYWM